MTSNNTNTKAKTMSEANKKYSNNYQAAHSELNAIMSALVDLDMKTGDDKNWADVGSVQSIADELKEIADRMLGRGEYAANLNRGTVYGTAFNREGKSVTVSIPTDETL